MSVDETKKFVLLKVNSWVLAGRHFEFWGFEYIIEDCYHLSHIAAFFTKKIKLFSHELDILPLVTTD